MTSILKVDSLQDSGGNAILSSDGAGTITTATALNTAITNAGFVTSANAGKVLQVVNGNHTSQASTTSTSFVDLSGNTNISITPSATSSKILIMAHFNELYYSGTTSHYIRVTGNGSEIIRSHTTFFPNLSGEKLISQDLIYLHSPNTTSAIEYKMQFRSQTGTNVAVNQNSAPGGSSLILMEIGA